MSRLLQSKRDDFRFYCESEIPVNKTNNFIRLLEIFLHYVFV